MNQSLFIFLPVIIKVLSYLILWVKYRLSKSLNVVDAVTPFVEESIMFDAGACPRGITPKLPKLDLTSYAEYAANIVNVIMWL